MAKKRVTTKGDFLSDYYKIPKTKAGVLADYEKMRRLANDRLANIEEARETKEGLENVLKYAYKRTVHDLNGATRFPTMKSIEDLNYNSVVGKLNAMRRFLKSETSTIRGVQATYKRSANAFNKKYGTDFSPSDLAKFFNKDTGLYEKIKNSTDYGSETIMLAIAEIKANREEKLSELNALKDAHIEVDDKLVQHAINDILNQYGDEVGELVNESGRGT